MDRRRFVLTAAGLLTVPLAVEAQQAAKAPRIGWLGGDPARGTHLREAFLQELRELGYAEGRNLVIDYRYAEAKVERFPTLAAELVALRVDVIVASAGTSGALAGRAHVLRRAQTPGGPGGQDPAAGGVRP
jgi:putative ABC transport system substrate-binding protein